MTTRPWLWLILLGATAGSVAAQPAPTGGTPSSPGAGEPSTELVPADEPTAGPEPVVQDIPADEPDVISGTVVQSVTQRVGLNVFADASFAVRSQTTPHTGFELGAIGLIGHAEFTDTLSAVTEIAFEFARDADGFGVPVADVERIQIQYLGPRLDVMAGRLHTELGYWNTAYHHGRWLQLTVDRPHAAAFEDDHGLLPIHSIGLQGRWKHRVGAGEVSVVGAVSNGRGRINDDITTLGDNNEMKALLLKVESHGLGQRDLVLGVSAMVDRIPPYAARVAANRTLTEVIGNGYLAFRGERLTLLTELYAVVHSGGGRWTTVDGYAVAGWATGRFTPFVLVEARAAPATPDPFYSPSFQAGPPAVGALDEVAEDLLEAQVGVRIELSEWSVVKALVEVERTGDQTGVGAMLNWSFGI